MAQRAYDDWSDGQMVTVPHAWRGDGILSDMQSQAQCRISAGLRALYAELIEQPLPERLERLVEELDARLEGRTGGTR